MKENKLKILIVSQYFWPENMRINDLVEGLLEKGHEVTILTGLPNYPEGSLLAAYKENKKAFTNYKGAPIIRVPMFLRGKSSLQLALNYFSFFLSASIIGSWKLRKLSFDALFVYAVSPITAAIPAIIIGRLKATPVFLWVLDLWPETLSAVGVIKNERLLNLLSKGVSWIYNRCDYILMQSKSFRTNILKHRTKFLKNERLVYFPNWAENIFDNPCSLTTSSLLARDEQFFTIVFAGNMGESQDFPAILSAMEALKGQPHIRLAIVGDGRMQAWVKEQIKARSLSNVLLLGRHPIEEMPSFFNCADALLVSLKTNEIFAKTIPGKIQAYLASGKPILGMIDGEAAQVILESGGGVVSPSGEVKGLVNNILYLALQTVEERVAMGQKGMEFYKKNFQSQHLFNQLENLFQLAKQA